MLLQGKICLVMILPFTLALNYETLPSLCVQSIWKYFNPVSKAKRKRSLHWIVLPLLILAEHITGVEAGGAILQEKAVC